MEDEMTDTIKDGLRLVADREGLRGADETGTLFDIADRSAWTVERARTLLPSLRAALRILADAKGFAEYVIEQELRRIAPPEPTDSAGSPRPSPVILVPGVGKARIKPDAWAPLTIDDATAIIAILAPHLGTAFTQQEFTKAVDIVEVPATRKVVADHGAITRIATAAGVLSSVDVLRRRVGDGRLSIE